LRRAGASDAFEDHLVEKEERDPIVGPLISAHRLAWDAGEHSNIFVVPPGEGTVLIDP